MASLLAPGSCRFPSASLINSAMVQFRMLLIDRAVRPSPDWFLCKADTRTFAISPPPYGSLASVTVWPSEYNRPNDTGTNTTPTTIRVMQFCCRECCPAHLLCFVSCTHMPQPGRRSDTGSDVDLMNPRRIWLQCGCYGSIYT